MFKSDIEFFLLGQVISKTQQRDCSVIAAHMLFNLESSTLDFTVTGCSSMKRSLILYDAFGNVSFGLKQQHAMQTGGVTK